MDEQKSNSATCMHCGEREPDGIGRFCDPCRSALEASLRDVRPMDRTERERAYQRFLRSKITISRSGSAEIDPGKLHPSLFAHQRPAVVWALARKRALVAMSFGLGKTRIEIELARILVAATQRPFLVVCPLAVKHQFQQEDGPPMGTDWQYVRTDADVEGSTSLFLITNYERIRDGDIDPRKHRFCGASLDEGSVIRSLGSKTYQVFEDVFADLEYMYIFTATPAPNRYKELIYYANFLGVMDSGQALTRWFKRDPQKAGNLTLHPQHERDYWLWVASWALFMLRPSDIGCSDEGYDLPELRVIYHKVGVDHSRAWKGTDDRGQAGLFLTSASGVGAAAKEKRETIDARLDKAREIIAAHGEDDHWLIWHHLEDERRAIENAIPDSVSVYGSQDLDLRESRILDFGHGAIAKLSTKPEIAGSGCNFQRFCHLNIFMGVNYDFQDMIQAVHRTYRFQQQFPVEVHIIYAESEADVVGVLKAKWEQYDRLTDTMREVIREHGLSQVALSQTLDRRIGVERREVRGVDFTIVNNDSVMEMGNLATASVGLICTSIPFGNHYEYTTNYEDFGHNLTDEYFFKQMDFLVPELLRVLEPGRLAAIHVKDRVLYGHQTPSGFMSIGAFTDYTREIFERHGFLNEGRRTIVTDVVRENSSTYRLGWSEMCTDASKMGAGLPEYLLLFRKPPSSSATQRADNPVTKDKATNTRGRWQIDAHNLWRSDSRSFKFSVDHLAGLDVQQVADLFASEQLQAPYDYERHVGLCDKLDADGHLPSLFMLLPPRVTDSDDCHVWDNVEFMRTLNNAQARRRERNHICPLPFDIVNRIIKLYSNPGDLVLDPFGGLGTTSYCAIGQGRKSYSIELNTEYFDAAVGYCSQLETDLRQPKLFEVA